MANDALILGPFVFTDFAVPEHLPLGGKQQMTVHKMPGGIRTIDSMGPDDRDRSFSGIHWGETALGDALTLDAMRQAGTELPYSNGAEARTVVISDFHWDIQKFNCIHYSISLVPIDSSSDLGLFADLGSLIASDAAALLDLVL